MKQTIHDHLENIERLATDVGDRITALSPDELDHIISAKIATSVYKAKQHLAAAFEAAEVLTHAVDVAKQSPKAKPS